MRGNFPCFRSQFQNNSHGSGGSGWDDQGDNGSKHTATAATDLSHRMSWKDLAGSKVSQIFRRGGAVICQLWTLMIQFWAEQERRSWTLGTSNFNIYRSWMTIFLQECSGKIQYLWSGKYMFLSKSLESSGCVPGACSVWSLCPTIHARPVDPLSH